jgi:hypothetical protein
MVRELPATTACAASMFDAKETMVGVNRISIFRILVLLSACCATLAASAGDWTFDPPPVSGRRLSPTLAEPPSSGGSKSQTQLVSFDDAIAPPADALETLPPDPVTPKAAQSTLPNFEEITPGDSTLLPIAMPEEFEEMLPPASPTFSSGRWFNRGRWYTQWDLTYLTISEKKGTKLAVDFSDPNNIPAQQRNTFNTQKGLGFAPGARITFGFYLGIDPWNRDSSVEFTYFGLNNWSYSRGITSLAPNSLYTVFDPTFTTPGFTQANSMSYMMTAQFNSYELNFRLTRRLGRDRMILSRQGKWVRELAPNLVPTMFGGMRLLTLNESFNWNSQGTDPATTFGQYNVRTHNALTGFQFGAAMNYQQSDWRAGVTVRGGPYVNFSDQFTTVSAIGPAASGTGSSTTDRVESNQKTSLSFVGEVNLNGAYYLRPNMAVRSSLEIMYLTDMALADKEITFVQLNPVKMSTAHETQIVGFTLGFEWNW